MKNKKLFSENRLTYFAEVQKLAESEVKSVKDKKEKEGPELDTKSLVDQVNTEMDKYSAQLKEMPEDFNKLLHDEIMKYFLSSTSRFEKDEKAGLSAKEFGEYRVAMIAKTKELLAEYAPTEEDIKKKKEADKQAKETQKNAENVKTLDVETIQEDPGAIPDLQTLNTKFDEYNGWNASLQKAGVDVLTISESVGKSYGEYKKNRDGVDAYKKFKGYLFPEDDKQRIDMQTAVNGAKQKVADALAKFDETKGKLKSYGEKLSKASDAQKQSQVAERTKALDEIDKHSRDSEETKKAREDQYKKLDANQKSLEGEKKTIEDHQKDLSKGKEAVATKEKDAKNKQESLTKFDSSVKAAIGRIDDALKNKELSPEEIQQLQETKKQLESKSSEVGAGLKATGEILIGTTKAATTLTGEEKTAADRSLNIKSHLEGQVAPTLTALDGSIKTLESAKMKFATTQEEVNEHFDKVFKTFDSVDESVDNAVLKNNMANEQINGQLTKMDKSLASMDTNPPSGISGAFEATIGVPFGMLGGSLQWAAGAILEQATWLSKSLADSKDEWTKTGIGKIGYWAARVGVEAVSTTIGVAGGLTELFGGVATMIAHPVDTAKGLGTLVGLNPEVSAGHAWAEMGKAMISWEDFKEGRIGVGIGKIFVNIVTTVTGAGAAGAASKAGKGAYIAAQTAGKGVARSIAEAGIEGTIAAGKFVGKEVGEGVGNVGKNIKSVKTFITGAEEVAGVAGKPNILVKTKNLAKSGYAAAKEMSVGGVAKEAYQGAKVGAEFVGGSFKSVGEGMVDITKRVFTKEGRADAKIQKLASKEAKLTDTLEKSYEKYEEFQEAVKKLREENPGMSEADLRKTLAGKKPGLFTEGIEHETNLNKLADAQKNFEKEVKASIKSKENFEKIQQLLEAKKNMQTSMVQTANEYNEFKKILESKDPDAIEAARQFQNTLDTGDLDKIALWVTMYAPQKWKKAFNHMKLKVDHAANLSEIKIIRNIDRISQKVHELTPQQIEKVMRLHPENYGAALELYRKIPEQAKILEAKGLKDCADELRNFDTKFSRVDGAPLGTPEQRLAYMEKLKNLTPVELEWYRNRPPKLPARQHPDYAKTKNKLKEYTAKFISEKLMPELVKKNMPLEDMVRELHIWQTKGSSAQMEILLNPAEGYNIAGKYRNVTVRVGNYWCPPEGLIPNMMKDFSTQIDAFSYQIEQLKNTLPPQAYENAVIQYATHSLQRFVEIHPMRDGNGRTARMLYEYIITKHLGTDSKYRKIPMGTRSSGESTLHPDLMEYNDALTKRDYPDLLTMLQGDKLANKLKTQTLDQMLSDPLISQFANDIKRYVDSPPPVH